MRSVAVSMLQCSFLGSSLTQCKTKCCRCSATEAQSNSAYNAYNSSRLKCQRSLGSVLEQDEAAVRTVFAQGTADGAQVAAGEEAFTHAGPCFLLDRDRADRRGCYASTTRKYSCAPSWTLQVKLFKMRPPCWPRGRGQRHSWASVSTDAFIQKARLVIIRLFITRRPERFSLEVQKGFLKNSYNLITI